MKTFVFLAFFAFVVLVSANAKKCQGNSDCEEDECCLHRFMFNRATCQPRRQEGEVCAMGDIRHHFHKDQHLVFCPCSEKANLECKAEKVEVKGDVTKYYNTKCAKKETVEEPVTEVETEEPSAE